MSQPLSQGLGRKVPIEKPPKRSYILPNDPAFNDARTERSIPAREAVILLLFLMAAVAAPVGAGVAWGVGVGVFVLGITALILAVLLGLE